MYAIAGGKGGCGKTTTTIGLAGALAAAGHRPLVVDADLGMPDLHVRLDVDRDPGLDALAESDPVRSVARTGPRHRGVTAVPAGSATPPIAGVLERVAAWPGPVLVDCPAGASPDVADPLRVADRTVLVSTATPQSLEDAAKTAAMARKLDATPVAVAVRGSTDDRSVRRLLDCEQVVGVPSSTPGRALDDPGVRDSYRRLATDLPAVADRVDGADAEDPSTRRSARTNTRYTVQ